MNSLDSVDDQRDKDDAATDTEQARQKACYQTETTYDKIDLHYLYNCNSNRVSSHSSNFLGYSNT